MSPFAAIPSSADLLPSLGLALGLGLLVGLQREWARKRMAGIRTFALVSLFGALCALMGLAFGGWAMGAGLIAIGALIVIAQVAEWKAQEPDSGLTTEMAMLVMFVTGALTVLGQSLEAVMIAGSVLVLLQSKKALHGMVRKIGEEDLREIARLVLAGLVILPALPNREMGYLGVLNPFSIWLMVVLIVGISLAAYLAGKFLGVGKGAALAGLIGGLVSSTAATASVARRSRDGGACGLYLAAIALIASAVVFLRVIVEVMVTAPARMQTMLPPLFAMMAWFGVVAAVAHRFSEKRNQGQMAEPPPSELKSAVLFGLLYAVVLIVVAAAREHWGNSGLYAAAAISGLTDMDAITLSTSRLASTGHLETGTAWRMILLGGLCNILFKMILAVLLGARAFIQPVLIGFGTALLGGAGILLFWP